jgi:hypothetical protein
MKEFLNEKVNIIIATKSGSGAGSGSINHAITNNTINLRGTLKSIDAQFIILEDVQLMELPQFNKDSSAGCGTMCYNYKKTAVNIDNIITISIV